jgi:arylsulfatase A-like enzyme
MKRILLVALAAGVAVAAVVVWNALRPAGRSSVILISIDTLRADRVGVYGSARETTPQLDALADRGVVFENVIAECSWTLPSHVTMLSGLAPSSHGTVLPNLRAADDVRFVSQILGERGYRTLGLTGGGYVGSHHGFDRGFETFDDTDRSLTETLERALAALDGFGSRERFFFFLHTYDVHCPYTPSPRFAELFGEDPEAEFIETRGRCGNPHFNSMHLSDGQVRFISNQYDASVREADDALGKFFAALDERGLLDRTVLIVTSDHGEEFQEHGQIGHERTLYRESLMVPLVIHAPSLRPRRVVEPVGLIDLAPTLLDLAGVEAPAEMEGRSLLPLIRGARDSDGVLAADAFAQTPRFSELDRHVPLRSVATQEMHLIVNRRTGRLELFDFRADPMEQVNLAVADSSRARQLAALIAERERARVRRQPPAIWDLSPEDIQRLRNLGYVN